MADKIEIDRTIKLPFLNVGCFNGDSQSLPRQTVADAEGLRTFLFVPTAQSR